MTALQRMANTGIVPVVVIDRVEDALPTARALAEGGIDIMEVTLRTEAGLGSIREVSRQYPDCLIGAGTATNLDQCQRAVDAGAAFIVMPGFNRSVVDWCVAHDIAVTPGCVTPTEIMAALECGISVLKFFPANVYAAFKHIPMSGNEWGPIYLLVRGPLQATIIAWVYWFVVKE